MCTALFFYLFFGLSVPLQEVPTALRAAVAPYIPHASSHVVCYAETFQELPPRCSSVFCSQKPFSVPTLLYVNLPWHPECLLCKMEAWLQFEQPVRSHLRSYMKDHTGKL